MIVTSIQIIFDHIRTKETLVRMHFVYLELPLPTVDMA